MGERRNKRGNSKLNENEDTTYQNLKDAAKAV